MYYDLVHLRIIRKDIVDGLNRCVLQAESHGLLLFLGFQLIEFAA
jgi:hypothetical protein